MNQAEIEQATGLNRELLRKWELRYQFPLPERGARGQRLYQATDLPKLRLVTQLMAQGLRPGKLVALSLKELQGLLASSVAQPGSPVPDDAAQHLLACLAPGSAPGMVRSYIAELIATEGLAAFSLHRLPAFNQAVGDAWAVGRLGMHAEHHYTDAVQAVVQSHLLSHKPQNLQQRILLTTPPGELHALGLLSVQAALTLQGAACFNLGVQTPVSDLVQAVKDWDITVIAISASIMMRPDAASSYLAALRRSVPRRCKIWAGGQGFEFLQASPVVGVTVFDNTAGAVKAWQKINHISQTQTDVR
jgi:DNA-binding transcriptional MerR regulator/methylmalonyl-CoA mutase cobalamin-binding subunit